MAKEKIGVFGASGFVGSALCERLFFEKAYNFVGFIHNYGSAARISRFPIEIRSVDLLEYGQVKEALAGCSTVVNCSRGGDSVMLKGLKNIIKAGKETNVRKFIHISSTAIYGDDPKPECRSELAIPSPGSNSYGVQKLKQDEMVFKLHRSGIPSIILCPSNISGPYSFFVLQAVNKVLSMEILLVDDGKYPSNLVHVENFVEAILVAIRSENGWGERYFVNDLGAITWKRFYEDVIKILGVDAVVSTIPRDEVMKSLSRASRSLGFADNLRILLSGEFRQCLSMVPIIKRLNDFAFGIFNRLDPELQKNLRKKLERPVIVTNDSIKSKVDQLVKVQIRKIYHSPEKIMRELGYRPKVTYEEGMESTRRWMTFAGII